MSECDGGEQRGSKLMKVRKKEKHSGAIEDVDDKGRIVDPILVYSYM